MVVGARQKIPEKEPGFSDIIKLCLNLSGGFALSVT